MYPIPINHYERLEYKPYSIELDAMKEENNATKEAKEDVDKLKAIKLAESK